MTRACIVSVALAGNTRTSVSYTHLDVYKRQVQRHVEPGAGLARFTRREIDAGSVGIDAAAVTIRA